MKRSEKGVLGIILAATLMIGATAVVSANGGTLVDPNSFASKGKIQVKENETDPDPAIVIDSADLVTLANATNELNTQFTDSLAAAVNNIGSVPKTDRVAAGATFSDLLKEIKNSQAIDTSESVYVFQNGTVTDDSTAEGVVEKQITGATEANLSAGTAAWVDGQYIVGTGVDNNSYYANGFSKGYADGVIDGQNKTGNITFEQHYHNSSCYTTCTITHTFDYIGEYDGVIHAWETITHSKCGTAQERKKSYPMSCDTFTESHSYTTCGYTEGQVLSATITYE